MMELQNNQSNNKNTKKDEGVANKVAPSSPLPETKAEKKPEFTEEKIKAMNGTQLRKLAKKHGIENPEEFTLGELKATMIGLLVG